MTEEHKNKIAEMLMNDYHITHSLAHLIVKVFIEGAELIIKIEGEKQINKEDSEIINRQIKD